MPLSQSASHIIIQLFLTPRFSLYDHKIADLTVARRRSGDDGTEMRCKKESTDREPLEDLRIWQQEEGEESTRCEVRDAGSSFRLII